MLVTTEPCSIDTILWNQILQLDLTSIAHQLRESSDHPTWTEHRCQQAIAQYRQFLYLIALYPDRSLVPTQAIDRVWHHHILDTMKYAQDCQHLFGRFIHHIPRFGRRGDDDRAAWQLAVTHTQALFAEHFGTDDIDRLDWRTATDCQPLVTVAV